MSQISTLMRNGIKNRSGSATIEFALVIALITLAIMVGVTASGDNLRKKYSDIGFVFNQPNEDQVED